MLSKWEVKELGDLVRILIRNQAHGDLCVGLARNHGLGSFTGVSSPNAVHVQRGPDGVALIGGVSLFTVDLLDVEGLFVILERERSPGHFVTLFPAELDDLVIEARNCYMVVFVVQRSNHLGKNVDRVRNGPTI